MNEMIINAIAEDLNITSKQVSVEIQFLLLLDIEKKQLVHLMRKQ